MENLPFEEFLRTENIDQSSTKDLPEIPESITSILLYNFPNLETITHLPNSLKKLKIITCNKLAELQIIPKGVEEIAFSDLPMLENIAPLPNSLRKLEIYDCPKLAESPVIPEGVEEIKLYSLSNLETITNFPNSLKKLKINNCAKLTGLPVIPEGVECIDLSCCENQIMTEELLERLEDLENRGVTIYYPRNFTFDLESERLVARLQSVCNQYKSNNPDGPPANHLINLFHRFLTEGIGQRGQNSGSSQNDCLKEVLGTATPIIEAFEKNPEFILWANEIAAAFLDGCVNQPVAGWSEIAAWVAIAKADSIKDKIEAAKHLLTIDSINEYIGLLPDDQKPGPEVEVEAGNALFREIHKRLLEQRLIQEPWLAVPQSVAYEGTIRNWLTEDRIAHAFEMVKTKIFDLTTEKIADILCSDSKHYCHNWAIIVFPQQTKKIEEEYHKEMEELDSNKSDYDDQYQQLKIESDTAILRNSLELTRDALVHPPIPGPVPRPFQYQTPTISSWLKMQGEPKENLEKLEKQGFDTSHLREFAQQNLKER